MGAGETQVQRRHWKLKSPYARQRALSGIEGLIDLYQAYRRATDALFRELDCARISVDTSDGNWPAIYAQVADVVDHGMNLQEAVSAPRFSSTSNIIDISNRIPRSVSGPLQAQGYDVVRNPFGYTIAWVHAIRIVGDRLEGGADLGRDGVAYEA